MSIDEELDEKENNSRGEVPTLELVDFTEELNSLQETHSHLPSFTLISNELGLIGEEYYPLKKFMCYFVESLRQPTISFLVGTETFDNRVHGLLKGGAGTGKGKAKNIVKKFNGTVECSGQRTNIEQLIGKMKKHGKEELEVKGYFGFKCLVVDEAQALIKEEEKNMGSLMREVRLAMDVYGHNRTEKKLVDNEELLSYFPETRFMLMTHNTLFPPVFFDTGTFRRMFAFELKQTKIKENDTIANLYRENKEQELKDYVNSNDFYVPKSLRFPKETIDEIVNWFLFWNKFLFLNPNQRVRAVAKGMVFSGKAYFFRLSAILAIMRGETEVTIETARLACQDTIHFLLKTIEIYANNSQPTMSRDIWHSEEQEECMFLEWLHYNGALKKEISTISIGVAQDKIQDLFGLQERQARSVYYKLKKLGFIKDYKGQYDSIVWLGFLPELECPIDFGEERHQKLTVWLESQKVLTNSANLVVEPQSGRFGSVQPPFPLLRDIGICNKKNNNIEKGLTHCLSNHSEPHIYNILEEQKPTCKTCGGKPTIKDGNNFFCSSCYEKETGAVI